jgi:hypothetical protein
MIPLNITKDVIMIVEDHEIVAFRKGSHIFGFPNCYGEPGYISYISNSEVIIPEDSAEVFDKKFSIEKHGDGYALYKGRSSISHGLNLCHLSDFDHNGEETRKFIESALNSYLSKNK